MTERDTVVRSDPDWEIAAREYVSLKSASDALAEQLDAAKQRLVALTSHTSEQGFGVTVSRYLKTGSVDYKRVPQLVGVDLDQYRGAAREEVRVTVAK